MDRITELDTLHQTLHHCRLCADAGYNIVPGAVMSGRIGATILSIGQAPGVTEVEAKRPFNAGSGKRLFKWLGEAGFDETTYRATQYMSSVTKCFPGKHKNGKGDRVPSRAEQKICRPFLLREIELVQPRLFIPIGGLAIRLFYPAKAKLRDVIGTGAYIAAGDWENADPFDLSKAVHVSEPLLNDEGGRYIVPLPHPSGASLWPNKPENKILIQQSIRFLGMLREKWGL